ncbi:MAG: hypothetical protein ACU83U_10970 [Gammaproteobacteria bacterium]
MRAFNNRSEHRSFPCSNVGMQVSVFVCFALIAMRIKPMKITVILFTSLLTSPVYAQVFKCKTAGSKTIYQSTPCLDAVVTPIEIKRRSAEKEAEAVAALKQWNAAHEAEEQAKQIAIKEAYKEKLREAEVRAIQKNAAAQQGQEAAQKKQAVAQKRQAAAMEKNNALDRQFYPRWKLTHRSLKNRLTLRRRFQQTTGHQLKPKPVLSFV